MTAEQTTRTEETRSTSGFRDRVATVDDSGRRAWIYPQKPSGSFHRARLVLSWVYLALFIAGPFVKINGQPALLLDVIRRKFIIFGLIFWPQDFHLFVLATLAGIVFILLFTAIYGRIFCGWVCPQTIFMELVFRKIEYFIEGDAGHQQRLNRMSWNAEKILKKISKHVVFYGLAFLFGNLFLAYIVGLDELLTIITAPPARRLKGLTAMFLFAGAFYFVFAWFREQVCTMVCPYGRFQGVLLDDNSIVVTYDFKRGEPRGKRSPKTAGRQLGDCVDCFQCVAVCPTGIDIRNGAQLECVNCTACIDACNHIMTRLERLRGLIRYSSHNSILTGTRRILTPRIFGYTVFLAVILGLFGILMSYRQDVEATVFRAPGQLYQKKSEHLISNLYTFKVVNKTFDDRPLRFAMIEPPGTITVIGNQPVLPGGALVQGAFLVDLDRANLKPRTTPIRIGVYSGGRLLDQVATTFLGPAK